MKIGFCELESRKRLMGMFEREARHCEGMQSGFEEGFLFFFYHFFGKHLL